MASCEPLLLYFMAIDDEVDAQLAQTMKGHFSEAKLDAEPLKV
jgi:hypothetical protein